MRLLMANWTIKCLDGLLYDVLGRIETFIFPINFVIYDYKVDFEVLIILGKLFLATEEAQIHMKSEELKF